MRQIENLKMLALSASLLLFVNCKREEKISVETNIDQYKSNSVKRRLATKDCDADFDVFFEKFASDSVFQKMHIKFPLKNSHLDEDYHDMVREDIPLSKYTFADFSNNSKLYDIDFIKTSDSLFYKYRGRDNGIYGIIKFAFENGCWNMVEIIDEST